jgi:hypothetical protein
VPPHLPDEHEHVAPPGHVEVQSVQTPLVPHAPAEVPAPQVPLVAAEQQPPLHVCVEEHAAVHALVVVSQASSAGQSVATVHPHFPLARHESPEAPPTHDTHASPVEPHAACVLPVAHVVPSQHPPLHGWVAEHVVVQAPVVVSHA